MPSRALITGIGMVTSVGNDAAGSCAAIRAGITRPGPLPVSTIDRDGVACEPVPGHPVRPLAGGFEGVAAHALLARGALRDLARGAGLEALGEAEWQRTALFLCVSPSRAEEPERLDAELRGLLGPVLALVSGLPIALDRTAVVAAGHAGVLLAARQAMASFQARQADRAIVVGVDSLVGEDEVAWLAAQGRLKTPEQPVGLMPGQAAGAFLLEPAERGRQGPAPLAFLADVLAEPVAPVREGELESDGKAIARAVAYLRAAVPGPVELYADQNGEAWRAREWGTALTHLARRGMAADLMVTLPALSLGDTGAASAAVAVCLAVRAFQRGRARAGQALVLARSEREHLGVARVEPARA